MIDANAVDTAAAAPPASVDVTAAFRGSNIQHVLDELEGELVGLAPVKKRIREIAALLLIARLMTSFVFGAVCPTYCPTRSSRVATTRWPFRT